ncbi:MAG: bifunctional diaminohydroxyphosphoribosylaminopyrimidine deaminase/5-amino-6-(5-phosphoribosylamino)uracil reductase RibD [Candidatus Micrarchaeota archaeon]
MSEYKKYMQLAIALAKKGTPSPNPYVGAVIVKNGKIIGKGYHKKVGMPHAEIEALQSLKNPEDARGADMYINLEPCNHYGRTPPCTSAIINAGIKRVIFAMKDPNPKVSGDGGDGEKKLKKYGIRVEKGLCETEAKKLNEVFIKYCTSGMPFVVLKIAMSMDGKIATRTGDSRWITCEKARKYVHKLRSKYRAILVGVNTILKDNPMLDVRTMQAMQTTRVMRANISDITRINEAQNKAQKSVEINQTNQIENPIKIILDNTLRIPLDAKVVDSNLIVATSAKHDIKQKAKLERKGVRVLVCGKNRVDLKILLKKLGEIGIDSILVEGGSEVQGSFFSDKLIDKFILFFAPKIIGGNKAKIAIGGRGVEKISLAMKLSGKIKKIGEDFIFEGYHPIFPILSL